MTKTYWMQVIERALKTALQTFGALIAASSFDWFKTDWKTTGATVLTATVLSVTTSLVAAGPAGTPSSVPVTPEGPLGPPTA